MGCASVRNDEIIARAHNERELTNDPTAHAEVLAIRRAGDALKSWRLSDCTLYVTLEPCAMCAGAISQARLARLVYGCEDSERGCAGSVYRIPEDPAFTHFCISDGGILKAECAKLTDVFFETRRHE